MRQPISYPHVVCPDCLETRATINCIEVRQSYYVCRDCAETTAHCETCGSGERVRQYDNGATLCGYCRDVAVWAWYQVRNPDTYVAMRHDDAHVTDAQRRYEATGR